MQTITYSKHFLNLISLVIRVTKAKRALFFRDGGRCRLTVSNKSMMIHIDAGPNDLMFDGDSVKLSSLKEFVDFSKAVGYPQKDGTSVCVDNEVSMAGHSYEYLKFMSNSKVLRSITADSTCFSVVDHKVPASRETDKMSLLATITLDEETLEDITENIKLVSCDFVTVGADDNVMMSMKGKIAQQIDMKINSTHSRIIDDDSIKAAYGNGQIRMFLSDFFRTLYGLVGSTIDDEAKGKKKSKDAPPPPAITFDTEIRFFQPSNVVCLKSFAKIAGADAADPINLYVGVSESAAAAISNFDMITDTFANMNV